MDCPIRAESGKGRSAHIFNLNERAVAVGKSDVNPASIRLLSLKFRARSPTPSGVRSPLETLILENFMKTENQIGGRAV